MTDGNGKTKVLEIPSDLASLVKLTRECHDRIVAAAEKATKDEQRYIWDAMKGMQSTVDFLLEMLVKTGSVPLGATALKFTFTKVLEPATAAKVARYYKFKNDEYFVDTGRRGFERLTLQSELAADVRKVFEPIVDAKVAKILEWKPPHTGLNYFVHED
jgi:hypothetical protein